jgi:acetylornithine deacetylase/succinyl-diaminopimelate desuccinylase-like protein
VTTPLTGVKARVLAALGRRRAELARLCAQLVRIPSENVTSAKERLVRLVRDNAHKLWDIRAIPVVRLGYTDGRFFRRSGVPTVVYGPRVFHMGGPDEYIEEEELFRAAMVHAGAIVDYLGAS